MFKSRKSFVFNGISLLEKYGYMLVEFDEKVDINLGLERTLDKGTVNKYKSNYDVYGTSYSNELVLELSIMKNPCLGASQEELSMTREDVRQLAAWLTSRQVPDWLYFEDEDRQLDSIRYYGMFTDIEPYIAGEVIGVTMTFTCTSSYGYTHEIKHSYELSSEDNTHVLQKTIINGSDEWEDYIYPIIYVRPQHSDIDIGNIVIINTSDAYQLFSGTLELDGNVSAEDVFIALQDAVQSYALTYGYVLDFKTDSSGEPMNKGNGHAVFFNLTEHNGTVHKCMSFLMNTGQYFIIEGGFMYFDTYYELPVYIDCQKVKIYDHIGRMVLYSTMGIDDVDSFYWFRLKHGENQIVILEYGGSDIEITYSEPRKVGELYAD